MEHITIIDGKAIIPEGTTKIDKSMTEGLLDDIVSLEIPSSVTEIGDRAFYGCTSLKQVSIPSSVTMIGDEAFGDCESLKHISLPSSVTKIGALAFCGCHGLESIDMPSVEHIGNYAFSGCSKLKSLELPSSLKLIGMNPFECTGLTSLVIPESVEVMYDVVFYECPYMETLEFKGKVKEFLEYPPEEEVFFQEKDNFFRRIMQEQFEMYEKVIVPAGTLDYYTQHCHLDEDYWYLFEERK